MIVLVMGVSGCGKSTIGAALAAALGADFLEADTFHSPANIAKMKSGTPLEDADRWPWLDAIGAALDRSVIENRSVVLACSALKASYRARLLPPGQRQGRVVFLQGSADLVGARLSGRKGHYMPPTLLPSQFATLEAPADAIVVDIARAPEEIVGEILSVLQK
ncbi:gluconokinase [Dongia rigui]|uniref:Gluconokinase n=1 Tax=Dongia rigui TaxID=940149 RepID=A0ABU5E2D6_9PROT|nr:gluconokinase [Dongia rigui]MDY0873639.1 gluconokinase [Dongia rigui]